MRTAVDAALIAAEEPPHDCPLCPRLLGYRLENRAAEPAWFNAPVPSFGLRDARLLIVGLAPGVSGANRTGRPFTGDFAGELLYGTLLKFRFARGTYAARPDDGLALVDCRITNAVRCVPPENKPTPEEARTCNVFLRAQIEAMRGLRVIVALGKIAHDAIDVGGGFGPVYDCAACHRVLLEFFEIDVEIVERAIADRRGVRAQFLEVVEFGYTVRAPPDEVTLQQLQRGLQLAVGELLAGTRLEMHGCDLHDAHYQ